MNRMLSIVLGFMIVSGTGLAMHREDLPEVERLADRLVRSADRVLDYAESRTHLFARDDRRIERSLRRFARSADRFRDTIEAYFDDSAPVYDALADLNEDAAIVNGRIRRLSYLSAIRSEWDRASRTLSRINRLVGDRAPAVQATAPSRYIWRDGRYWTSDNRFYYQNGRWVEADPGTMLRRTITRRVLEEIED